MLTKRAEKKSEVPKIHLLICHWKCVSQCRCTFWNFSQHEKCDSPLSALCLNLNALCLFGDFCFCRTIKFVPPPPPRKKKCIIFAFLGVLVLFCFSFVIMWLNHWKERDLVVGVLGWSVPVSCTHLFVLLCSSTNVD